MACVTPFQLKKEAKRLLWLLPGPVFYALFRLSFLWPEFTETVYSRSIFPFIIRPFSALTGLAPFSVGEMLLYTFILSIAVFFVVMLVHAVMAKRNWWQVLFRRITVLLGIASALYALFIGLWGFNYARLPLSNTLELDVSPATVSELHGTCEALLCKANSLRELVPEDENGVFSPESSRLDIMRAVPQDYEIAADATGLSFFGGYLAPVKPVTYSTGLSWSHIAGIYFPFTAEANVNIEAPMLLFAANSLHEAAHQRGFAREDEANFLAYYVSAYSDDVSVQYSGTVLALVHSMNALFDANKDLYYELRGSYHDGLVRDIVDNNRFWAQFESEVSEAAQEVNNTFLKANMQQDGVKSYGRMVDLLIGLWRQGDI